MKRSVLILITVFLCACSDSGTNYTGLREPGAVFSLGLPTSLYDFASVKTAPSLLYGKWKLTDSRFYYSKGVISNLSAFLEIPETILFMEFKENEINKIVFYDPVGFYMGSHEKLSDSPINHFAWTICAGRPVKDVSISYSNGVLSLLYDAYITIHGKQQQGWVVERYERSVN